MNESSEPRPPENQSKEIVEEEASESQAAENKSEAVVDQIRTKEPRPAAGAEEPDHNTMSDASLAEKGPGEETEPGIGGYGHRDPKTDMPAIPSVKETQDDPMSHDAAPSQNTPEPSGSE